MLAPSESNAAALGDIAKVVLMPGDPLRAKFVAENYLENPICFNEIRNMLGYTGTYKGKKVSVMGSGMGVPSICLYAFELYKYYDVDSIIRIGSAGGISDDVKLRDVIIAIGASSNSNYDIQYQFPGKLSATASYPLLKKAAEAAESLGVSAVVGQVFTSDHFYNANAGAAKQYRDMGLLAVEMETYGLYLTAMGLHKSALSILTVSDHIFTGEALSALDRQNSFREMMEVALQTAWDSIK
ncbi:MAG: purine-nucleoside phosphorylase [Clostridiales bacterium]|jgi:purine-nucleoside phosphorylase|nr:purine-nucleoside phosphorylase [Clostridiales bacterium]